MNIIKKTTCLIAFLMLIQHCAAVVTPAGDDEKARAEKSPAVTMSPDFSMWISIDSESATQTSSEVNFHPDIKRHETGLSGVDIYSKGTASLCVSNNNLFLLTADHVLRGAARIFAHHPAWKENVVELPLSSVHSYATDGEHGIKESDRLVDLAIIRLNSVNQSPFSEFHPRKLKPIDNPKKDNPENDNPENDNPENDNSKNDNSKNMDPSALSARKASLVGYGSRGSYDKDGRGRHDRKFSSMTEGIFCEINSRVKRNFFVSLLDKDGKEMTLWGDEVKSKVQNGCANVIDLSLDENNPLQGGVAPGDSGSGLVVDDQVVGVVIHGCKDLTYLYLAPGLYRSLPWGISHVLCALDKALYNYLPSSMQPCVQGFSRTISIAILRAFCLKTSNFSVKIMMQARPIDQHVITWINQCFKKNN